MQTRSPLRIALAAAALLLCARTSHAANYSVYIHGFTGLSSCGATPSGWCYWGGYAQPGINPVAANYNGTVHLSTSYTSVKSVLDSKCLAGSGSSCYIAAHSFGCGMMGYLEALYPGRWSIIWVDGAGCAAGGSELANALEWADGSLTSISNGAVTDLTTSNMRAMYNHDKLGDYISGYVYTFMGGDWAMYDNGVFPGGGNDIVVAYHSSGLARSPGAQYGVPSSVWDYTLNTYVDDYMTGSYYHVSGVTPLTGGTGPITGLMANDMATYAN
jgi:hypothetical protein